MARAIQLAATALDEPDWAREAVHTLETALRRPWDTGGIRDATLCHGSAGVLYIASLVTRDVGTDELRRVLPILSAHAFDEVNRKVRATDIEPLDQPGFSTAPLAPSSRYTTT